MKKILSIVLVMLIFFLNGCSKRNSVETDALESISGEKLELKQGSFSSENLDGYFLNKISEDNQISKKKSKNIILNYNEKSNNYLYNNKGKYYYYFNEKDIPIKDERIIHSKISTLGNKLFYFIDNEFLQPIIYDFNNDKRYEIKNKALISGNFIDWISDNQLLYYGVESDKKIAGIYLYDIDKNLEKLIYKFKDGYVDFLKKVDEKILFNHIDKNGKRTLVAIDNNFDFTFIANDIFKISDIVKINEKYYVCGINNKINSIYEINNKNIKRVVYDFPEEILFKNGLSKDKNGNLLFIGKNYVDDKSYVYKYNNNVTTKLTKQPGTYYFINFN